MVSLVPPTPKLLAKAACFAIAALGASAFAATIALPNSAYAKNGNGGGGGNGGGKGGGKEDRGGGGKGGQSKGNGGKSGKSSKSAKGKSAKASASKAKPTRKAAPAVVVTKPKGKPAKSTVEVETQTALHPSEKGKWNAANANQAALDAHIRNQNFNGTIGTLAQFQLAAKAASGEELTDDEQAALDTFVDSDVIEVSDEDLAELLNAGAIEGDPVFSVEDGIADCTENCDGVDLDIVQTDLDLEAERLEGDATQEALDGLLADSENRIVAESNKPLSPERTEDLLDELARDLGVSRAVTGEELVEEASLPDDTIVVVVD